MFVGSIEMNKLSTFIWIGVKLKLVKTIEN